MRVIVTCGPSYEPIDHVRRLTNASTGELGFLLCGALSKAGCEVICLKGAGATSSLALQAAMVSTFTTNEHLLRKLQRMAQRQSIVAVFHAAALTDFRLKAVRTSTRSGTNRAKISSREAEVVLTLAPAIKIIDELRRLFPDALIVGWKYELDGGRTAALEKANEQMRRAGTDLCVLNGRAYGPGFGLLQPDGALTHFRTKAALCAGLAALVSSRARDARAAAGPAAHKPKRP